jgi:tRNA threonylcarbamoyladenosine biosynthesis protein TsaB
MKLLALETSTEFCSVALWRDGEVVERCELVGQKHSEVLIEMIDTLLRENGEKLKRLDGIAFGKGPGSFTGVRIACGATQGLALGANLPVVGVSTLEALAEATGRNRVVAALDARMNELYLAAYESRDGAWQTAIEPCLCKPEEAPIPDGDGWFGAGSGFAVQGEAIGNRYAGRLDAVDGTLIPRASSIARIASVRFERGEGLDAEFALPLYLRDKVALKTHEREQQKLQAKN